MGLSQLLVPFFVVWFCIHAFFFLLQRFLNRPNLPTGPGNGPDYELLPTTASSGNNESTTSSGLSGKLSGATAGTDSSGLLVKPFQIRFYTTYLNSFFFRIGSAPRWAKFWRVWYGLGVAFGMLALVLGWALLVYAAIKLVSAAVVYISTFIPFGTSSNAEADSEQASVVSPLAHRQSYRRFQKRDLAEDVSGTEEDKNADMVLVPIIPGVTLPLSHLPYYLIALLVSGVVHEAGHAIAAARERTQISSSGMFLYILYPGAFVDFTPRALAILSPLQQLRVICAGVWHNIVLFALAWCFLWTGALQFTFKVVGWQEMNDGLSVVNVANDSPLFEYLRVGSVIHGIDDTYLMDDPLGIWSKVLLTPEKERRQQVLSNDMGFCVPKTLLYVQPSDCCLFTPKNPFGHSQDMSLLCFTPVGTQQQQPITSLDINVDKPILAKDGQCVPSSDILSTATPARCSTTNADCGPTSACFRPFTPYQSVVRLHYTLPTWLQDQEGDLMLSPKQDTSITSEKRDVEQRSEEKYHVIVYQGDPKDIWEAIRVTTMRTRWAFLPLGFPNAVLLTIRYIMSFSLALSILNIVPARHLDGHHALKAAMALVFLIRQSYKSTQSWRESFVECLWTDSSSGGTAMVGSTLSTAIFPKGVRAVKAIVGGTTMLLGGVIVGSLVQMVFRFFWA